MEDKQIFDSWKEIAAYLKRSVKTCQRWESELGLPIRRSDGASKAKIFASKDEIDRWQRKTQHLDEETPAKGLQAGRRKKFRWICISAGVVVILVALTAIVWRVFPVGSSVSPLPINPSLAVLDFETPLGDKSLEEWTTALADLIAADLMQSKVIYVVPPDRMYGILRELKPAEGNKYSAEELVKVAERADVGCVASGKMFKAGNKIAITILVQNPHTREVAKSLLLEYQNEDELFSKVDRLTKDIKRVLNVSRRQIAEDTDKDIGTITTRSAEAFILYSQGCRCLEAGNCDQAIANLEKAISIDPNFAMAHWKISEACLKLGRTAESQNYMQKAFALSDRVSERSRLLIQGAYYRTSGETKGKSIAAYQNLLSIYPYEYAGAIGLSEIYARGEQWDKALPILEKLLEKNGDDLVVCLNLADSYAGTGSPDRAEKLLEIYESKFPEKAMDVNRASILYAIIQRKFDVALRYVEKAFSLSPNDPENILFKARVHFYQGDLASAEKEFQAFISQGDRKAQLSGIDELGALYLLAGRIKESKYQIKLGMDLAASLKETEWEKRFHLRMAYLCRISGNLEGALEEAEAACRKIDSDEVSIWLLRAFHERALILLELNRMEEFEKQAGDLKGLIERAGNPKLMRIYDHLLARRELKQDKIKSAFEYSWRAFTQLPFQCAGTLDEDQAGYFYTLGEVNEKDVYGSKEMYVKATLLTLGRTFSGDLYAKSLYKLGKFAEESLFNAKPDMIKPAKQTVIANYQAFLDLWKNADPIFPEIGDARQRLDKLSAK
jgi:tetratricopeptide (TPR) repeat protein